MLAEMIFFLWIPYVTGPSKPITKGAGPPAWSWIRVFAFSTAAHAKTVHKARGSTHSMHCNNLYSLFIFHQRVHPWIICDCISHPLRRSAAPGTQHTGASCVCVSLEKDRVKREDQWNTQGSGCIIPICVCPLKSLWYSCLGMSNIPF